MRETDNELMKRYFELGDLLAKFSAYQSIMQIDIDVALEIAEEIDNEDKKLRFLGRQYLDLVDNLKKAGIVK